MNKLPSRTTTRNPLNTLSASYNNVTKSSVSAPKGAKTSENFRSSAITTANNPKPSIIRPNSAKNTPSLKLPAIVSPKESVPIPAPAPGPSESLVDVLKMENVLSGREITEPPKPADKISTQFSGLTTNHEQCFERQRELVSQFKTESEVQNSDITKLRSEISRWKETLAHAEAEVVSLKEKNLSLNNSNMTQDATIIGLRREILLLQRKIEAGHEGAALGQLDAIKLRRELAELKGDAEELKAAVAKERGEKEAFWAQVQEETRKIQALQESNARFKEESRGLVSLVEKMRDEMKLLRASNEEALKYIMHK